MSKSKLVPPPLLSRSSISSDETPLQTPSFTPNAPAQFISDKDLTLKELEKDAKQAEEASGLDLDLPISTLLREGTKRAHVQAENSAGAEALVKGELPLEEYIKWLAVLWRVYE
jgi:heme oxygenase